MSNDTPQSPPGPQPAGENELQEQDEAPGTASSATTTDASSDDSSEVSDETKARRAWHNTALKQRLAFLTDLLKRLDTLIYAEIALLYYLEASFPRLLLRLVIHTALLSPSGPLVPAAAKPYVQGLLTCHIICVLLHCYVSLPRSPKGSRGYIHGGVWPDFIGQRPPTSRIYLLLLDFIIVGAQFFMLAVLEQSKKVWKALQGNKELEKFMAEERGEVRNQGDIESGDLEAAERGEVGRTSSGPLAENQDGLISSSSSAAGPSRRSNNLSSESEAHPPESAYAVAEETAHPLDEYNSGNVVLAAFHVMHTATGLYNRFDLDKSDQSLQSAGYITGLYWTRLQRVAGRAPV